MYATKNRIWLILLVAFLFCVANVSQAAVDIVLKDIVGKTHRFSQYKGKWVVVNYWATWCPPCLEEVPDLVALYDSQQDKDVMVFGHSLKRNAGLSPISI